MRTGDLGGLRATSFISSDRSLLRDTSGAPASALLCPHSGSFFSVSFSWRRARCFSPYQQPNMSWAVTAWPPVGGLGGRITHRHPHTPSTYTNTHIRRLISTRTWTHAQRPTHYLNSLDFTLLTAHLPDNSHSDFLRDEKCFRATRRLVFFLSGSFPQRKVSAGLMPARS